FKGVVSDDNVGLVRWSTLVSQIGCILIPSLIFGRLRFGTLREAFQLKLPRGREILSTVIAVFALQQVLQGYMMLQQAIPLPDPIQQYVDLLEELIERIYRTLITAHSIGEFLFVILTVALVPAVAEEILFRGVVQRTIAQATGGLRAAFIAGMIFGAYHLNPLSIVPLIALGTFFGYIVYRSRNLTLALSAHFFNNFLACTAVYLNMNDDFIALAPEGNPSPGIVVFNVLLFAVVFLAATSYFAVFTGTKNRE
ncbi:MAG: CPBP family intramembrane metalloprotease, partial [Bacteroidetes bacterium]|nr:CPBP family intramembrane metalloprotease [Bacteroidota bacterium]